MKWLIKKNRSMNIGDLGLNCLIDKNQVFLTKDNFKKESQKVINNNVNNICYLSSITKCDENFLKNTSITTLLVFE